MRITKQTLPLFNEMYELKFSEDAMDKAFTVQEEAADNLRKLKKDFSTTCVGTIDLIISNGLNQITHTMYISKDWNGSLDVKSLSLNKKDEKDSESLTPTEFYFQFNPTGLCGQKGGHHLVHLKTKTMDPIQLYNFLENLHFCNQIGTKVMSKKEFTTFDKEKIYDDLSWFLEISSGPSMLEKIKADTAIDGSINTTQKLDSNVEDLKEVCSWLMPKSKVTEVGGNSCEDMTSASCSSENAVGYIEYIFEKDNYRLGILNTHTKDYWGRGDSRRLFLLGHKDELFNYADVGRISLLGRGSGHYASPLEIDNVLGRVIFTEDVVLPTGEALDWVTRQVTGENTTLLDASQLKLSVKKFSESVRRQNEEAEEKKLLEAKLQDKIKSLDTGKKILLNGMTIEKTKLEYEGQILSRSDPKDWVTKLLADLTRMYRFDDINWDSVFDMFIASASYNTSKGQIGDVKFDLVFEETTNRVNVISTKTYINKKRINKNEVHDCLRRAVCYTEQEDFDEFLTNVSQCSLKFHRYLQIGLDFSVRGMRHNEGFSFKLPLERKKNLMYIVLEDSEFKIRDTNRLINMQGIQDLGEIMDVLLGDKVIEGLTVEDAKRVLKLAKIEFQDAITKSKVLLEETEKALKIKIQTNIQMDGSSVKEGYIVNGKLRQYVVATTDRCEVYEYPSGRYICIVDKSTAQAGKDKLINRLYALTNDQALAKDIHTLK
ncbi:hypothetical protein LCGC14_1209450 [marine sediment metagenome]|uniref:Uncharacterized protein n=1 Tax=marine sediment metagenome TaxID=412755 RepID=A0A0F9NWV4_9ZZZZ